MYYGVACVHHWCKLSRTSKEDCPRTECHYVHQDYMPTSECLKGVGWLVVPSNLRVYMSAGRKGRGYSNDNTNSDDDGDDGGEWDVEQVKRIQEDELAGMSACVARGEATWDSVVLACDWVVQEQQENEERLEERMGRNRRRDAFLIQYE